MFAHCGSPFCLMAGLDITGKQVARISERSGVGPPLINLQEFVWITHRDRQDFSIDWN